MLSVKKDITRIIKEVKKGKMVIFKVRDLIDIE